MAQPGRRPLTRWPAVLVAVLVVGLWAWQQQRHPPATAGSSGGPAQATQPAPAQPAGAAAPAAPADADALPGFLPAEARTTIALIRRGGPFPHPQDGQVFGNFEGHLPSQPRGWYHEYTVQTPGLSHRGTRRIVTGGNPPSQWWYSDDHYRSFRPFEVVR